MSEISVIIPVYNIEDFIERAVHSVLNQTLASKLEIILVDDGSSDNSGAVCDKLAEEHANISVIHQSNQGVSAARNAGIMAATSTYIGFVDGDDSITPNMYELLLNNIKQESADISCVGYSIHRRSGMCVDRYNTKKKYLWNTTEALFEMLSEKHFDFLCWDKLYKREHALKHPFDTTINIGEDRQFVFENICSSNKIVYEDVCCYLYDKREGSAMDTEFTQKNVTNYEVAYKMCEYIISNYSDKRLNQVAKCHQVRIAYKTLEKLELVETAKIEYATFRKQLYENVRKFKLYKSFGYLAPRHIFALALMKYCPIIYVKLCQKLDV